jgi:hypothetical protein
MAGMKDDWSGLVWTVILIGGAAYLWNRYVSEPDTPPVIETVAKPQRPAGLIPVTRFEAGTIWRLDADSITGPAEARQAWVIADHTEDKTVTKRETKTLYRIDCNTTAYRTLSSVEYDSKGGSLNSWKEADSGKGADFPPPGSNIAAVIDIACNDAFSLPKPKQLSPAAN